MNFEEIGAYLNTLSPWMIFLIVIFYLTIKFFQQPITEYIKSISFLKKKTFSAEKLKNHDLFSSIDLVRRQCSLQKFYTHGKYDNTKTLMFVDFMNFKLDSIETHMSNTLTNLSKNLYDLDSDELKNVLLQNIEIIVSEYIEKTRNHFIQKGIPENDAKEIIDIFERWRLETVESLLSRITSIFSSSLRTDNFQKLLACFEALTFAVELITKDGIHSFESANGKFLGVKYS